MKIDKLLDNFNDWHLILAVAILIIPTPIYVASMMFFTNFILSSNTIVTILASYSIALSAMLLGFIASMSNYEEGSNKTHRIGIQKLVYTVGVTLLLVGSFEIIYYIWFYSHGFTPFLIITSVLYIIVIPVIMAILAKKGY